MNVVKYSVVFFFHCSLFPVFLFFSVIMFCKYEGKHSEDAFYPKTSYTFEAKKILSINYV